MFTKLGIFIATHSNFFDGELKDLKEQGMQAGVIAAYIAIGFLIIMALLLLSIGIIGCIYGLKKIFKG